MKAKEATMNKKSNRVDVADIFVAIDAGRDEMTSRQIAVDAKRGRPKTAPAKESLFVRLQELDQEIARRRAAQGRGSVTLGGLVEELLRAGLEKSSGA
jgi:hypothetical protein